MPRETKRRNGRTDLSGRIGRELSKHDQGAASAYSGSLAGYGMDFGVIEDGSTVLDEVNDGYSLGAYGFEHYDYVRARWAGLANEDDLRDFGLLSELLLWVSRPLSLMCIARKRSRCGSG